MKKRALVSVSNRTGIVPFVKGMVEQGIEVIASSGTKQFLQEQGVSVLDVSEIYQSFAFRSNCGETMHPDIYRGVLADRGNAVLSSKDLVPIDYVIVNLPIEEEVSVTGVEPFTQLLDRMMVDEPMLLRLAAKNMQQVAVVVDPCDYDKLLATIQAQSEISLEQKRKLSAKAFRHLATSATLLAERLTNCVEEESPETYTVTYVKQQQLYSGENPHQKATFYREVQKVSESIAFAEQLHGKELSYNHIVDADIAIHMIQEFDEPAVAVVKQSSPCSVGTGQSVFEAYQRAYEADSISIFGSVVIANRTIDAETAGKMQELFLVAILAPAFSSEALAILQSKKNVRLFTADLTRKSNPRRVITSVEGGLLVQDRDILRLSETSITIPTKRKPTEADFQQLQLAWKVAKHVKSNAAVIVKNGMTIGVGAGHLNRIGAIVVALRKAGEGAQGAVLACDAFLSMSDIVETAAKAGVTAIIQPGGSMRDQESVDRADECGIAMVITGTSHFKH